MREENDKLKNKGPMVSRKTAKEVQLLVLTGLKKKLKQKNEAFYKEVKNGET